MLASKSRNPHLHIGSGGVLGRGGPPVVVHRQALQVPLRLPALGVALVPAVRFAAVAGTARSGSNWVWCCDREACRAQWSAARRELRQLRLMEKTLACWSCHASFTRHPVRVLEATGPDDVLEVRHVVIQRPTCSCPPPTSRLRLRRPGTDEGR